RFRCTIDSRRYSHSASASSRCCGKFPDVSRCLTDEQPVNIVGAGLAGALLSVMLARHGCGGVRPWGRWPRPTRNRLQGGRSLDLALAARGIRALEHAGVMDRIRPLLIPMRGRMIHEKLRSPVLQPYGQREDEVIYSVSRAALNYTLIDEAARHQPVTIRF